MAELEYETVYQDEEVVVQEEYTQPRDEHSQSSSSQKRKLEDEYADPGKILADSSHGRVVASHYNTLQEKGLYERSKSKIFYMRNFNNWIKSMLINKYLTMVRDKSPLGTPLRVLDMCCGKGGDLLKWTKGNISHLICCDIAEVSVEQCETRYKNLTNKNDGGKLYSAEFFTSDVTINRLREKYRDPSIELNLVSCQFAFHYCFESLVQAECMIRNAAECLKPGGFFIGTIPNSFEIMRRQKEADSYTFGNDVYQIEFLCDPKDVPLFGAKYNFQLDGVVDCPEFLVHFPTLVKLAKRFGLELVEKCTFEEYYNEMIDSGKGLIEKMQGLEAYPRYSRENREDEDEYEHAKAYVSAKGGGNRFFKVGTLSKSEWEASCEYEI